MTLPSQFQTNLVAVPSVPQLQHAEADADTMMNWSLQLEILLNCPVMVLSPPNVAKVRMYGTMPQPASPYT
jgi:hypothetical protein